MNIVNLVNLSIFLIIVSAWIIARYKFFTIKSDSSRRSSYYYDFVAGSHIVITITLSLESRATVIPVNLGTTIYLVGFFIFLWAMKTAHNLDFAFGNKSGKLVTTGPYAFVRHPLYLSYFIVWMGGTLMFNSILLWITLILLTAFYILSAKVEENYIQTSELSMEYKEYRRTVGMFLPRINQWKKWLLKQ